MELALINRARSFLVKKLFVYGFISLFLLFAFSMTSVYAKGNTHHVNMSLSGSIMDVDQEGNLKLFDLNLKDKHGLGKARVEGRRAPVDSANESGERWHNPLGSANARGVGWAGLPLPYTELPPDNVCNDITAFSPCSGVIFEEFQMTVNFRDGSLLFANLLDGYLCFSPSLAVGTYSIAGGTGRFEAATGWLSVEIITHRFNEEGHPSLVTAETGTLVGEIILP